MKVISVKFKENGRSYYFDPCDFEIKEGDYVIVTTARGTECGEVVRASHEVPGFSREVKPVIRVADAWTSAVCARTAPTCSRPTPSASSASPPTA